MERVCLLLVLGLGLPGCFVFEEIDKGRALMEQHSPKDRGAAAEPAASDRPSKSGDADEGLIAGLVQGAQDWWTQRNQPEAPQRDPDDVVVRCEVAGSTRFMRKHDCELQGGRPV